MIRGALGRRLLGCWPLLQTLPIVGVAISDILVVVSLKAGPPRLTGVYRCPLEGSGGGSVADRRALLADAAAEARRTLRVPAGTPAVLALQPTDRIVRLSLAGGWCRRPVPVCGDPAAVSALDGAGFAVERFDVVPAALARFALRSTRHAGRISTAGWSVTAADTIDAAANPPRWMSEGGGADGLAGAPPLDLRGVRIPAAVARHIDIGSDAVAIGAALRGLGHRPDLMVELVGDLGPPDDRRRPPGTDQGALSTPTGSSAGGRSR